VRLSEAVEVRASGDFVPHPNEVNVAAREELTPAERTVQEDPGKSTRQASVDFVHERRRDVLHRPWEIVHVVRLEVRLAGSNVRICRIDMRVCR